MPTATCKIYGLFVTSIVGLILGIVLLILSIVFHYIGFVESDVSVLTCTQLYFNTKYRHVSQQLQASFVGILISNLMLIIVIILLIVTIKNLKAYTAQNKMELIPSQVLSRPKYAAIYLLLAIGTLGSIVCFATYSTYLRETQAQLVICPIYYDFLNLLALSLISGAWFFIFFLSQIFVLTLNSSFYIDPSQQRQSKYKEMINVTQQPGTNPYPNNSQNVFKYGEQTQDPNQNDVHSFGNNNQKKYAKPYQRKNQKQSENQQDFFRENSFGQANKKKPPKQNFQEYQERQMRELLDKNNNNNYPHNTDKRSPNNKNSSQKPYSPVRMLGDSKGQHFRPNEYESQNSTPKSRPMNNFGNSPQRAFNNKRNYIPQTSDRGDEANTRGQLVFYKKGLDSIRNNNDVNQRNAPFRRQKSEGQLSFKSPSRFDSKFQQEERDYLNKNSQNSILPPNNFKEVTNASRRAYFDDKYNSSEMQKSNFGQSRNRQGSLGDSKQRPKVREGVLTSYIRGKFS